MADDPTQDMTWEEAESVVRQRVKELRTAEKMVQALRLARESREAVVTSEAVVGRVQETVAAKRGEVAILDTEIATQRALVADLSAQGEALRGRLKIAQQEAAAQQQEALREMETLRVKRAAVIAEIEREAQARRAQDAQAAAGAKQRVQDEINNLAVERDRLRASVMDLQRRISSLPHG